MTSQFFRTCLETQNRPNYWYARWFFVWCSLRQQNLRLNSGLKPATIVTDPYYTIALLLLHVNVLFRMKIQVIDTVSVLYDQIAVHLNYYTITLYLLHVNVLFRIESEVIDTMSVLYNEIAVNLNYYTTTCILDLDM